MSATSASEAERTLLLFSLRDPMNEDACCALAMLSILQKCFPESPSAAVSLLQAPILRAIMTLLSTYVGPSGPQHDYDCFPTVLDRLTICRCKPAIRAQPFHSRGANPGCCVWGDFISRICHELLASLRQLTPGEFRARKSGGVSNEDQPWPNSAKDLFPRHPAGEHEVIMGLGQWALFEPGVLPVMSAIARFWDPFACMLVPLPFVIKYPLIHLEDCVKGFKHNNAHALHTFIQTTTSVAHTSWMVSSYLENIKELSPLAVRVDAIAEALEGELPVLGDVRTWCFRIKTMQAGQQPQMRRELELFAASPAGIFTLAFKTMLEVRSRDQCLYIECEHKPNGPAQICSGCGVVRYCSSECQSAAWKDPVAPHRPICKAIKKLRGSLNMTGLDEWTRALSVREPGLAGAWDHVRFAQACIVAHADVKTGEIIGDGLRATTARRTDFLNERAEYAPWVKEMNQRAEAEEEEYQVGEIS
ncbi:hypothetical protein C8F01DRAFT_1106235 [Mycena amicta]|nr:hypothetical protein C8F01DRAFT_1106235 [Mycena amicta]